MRPHPRTRKIAKWLLTAFAVPLAIVTISSFWYGASFSYCDPTTSVTGSVKLSHGILRWTRYWSSSYSTPMLAWEFARHTGPAPTWTWQFYDPGPIGKHLFLPLYFPAALAAIPAAFLWQRDLQMAARSRIGHCPLCGYDRKGLAPYAKCPECGRSMQAT